MYFGRISWREPNLGRPKIDNRAYSESYEPKNIEEKTMKSWGYDVGNPCAKRLGF